VEFPHPGCFAIVETDIVDSRIKSHLSDQVTNPAGVVDTVVLPTPKFDWTAMPRFTLGYRLPSGFGELSMSYRFLATQGVTSLLLPEGPSSLKSRLDLSVFDFDYSNREYSPLPNWDMRWIFGGRLAYTYFDSRANLTAAQALAGNGLLAQRISNSTVGFGPHTGVELVRHLGNSGLSLVSRIEGSFLMSRIRQGFGETFIDPANPGGTLDASARFSGSQVIEVLNAQFGLGWQPRACPAARLFVGYQFEYWWNIARLGNQGTDGDLRNQGLAIQGAINY
jgi:hypothetical protein